MGHTGSIEARYTTNKSILPKLLEDEMREAFRRSEEFLDFETKTEKEEEIINQRVVTEAEFEKLVTEGWQYLGTLPTGKIVIKKG